MKTCFSGGEDLAQALRTGRDASFNEADHPRDTSGKFGAGSGANKPAYIMTREEKKKAERQKLDRESKFKNDNRPYHEKVRAYGGDPTKG